MDRSPVLGEEGDLKLLMAGNRKTHTIMFNDPITRQVTVLHTLKGPEDDTALEHLVRNRADTIYHPIGTC